MPLREVEWDRSFVYVRVWNNNKGKLATLNDNRSVIVAKQTVVWVANPYVNKVKAKLQDLIYLRVIFSFKYSKTIIFYRFRVYLCTSTYSYIQIFPRG